MREICLDAAYGFANHLPTATDASVSEASRGQGWCLLLPALCTVGVVLNGLCGFGTELEVCDVLYHQESCHVPLVYTGLCVDVLWNSTWRLVRLI